MHTTIKPLWGNVDWVYPPMTLREAADEWTDRRIVESKRWVARPRPSLGLEYTGLLTVIFSLAWFSCITVVVDHIWPAIVGATGSNWLYDTGYVLWYTAFLGLFYGGIRLWDKGASRRRWYNTAG